LLDQCIDRGLYGDQAMTVRHFVIVGLERLIEQGRLADSRMPTPAPKSGATNGDSESG